MPRLIAIVEDEPAIRENYADAFRRQGYKVAAYANRGAARQSLFRTLPDLIILDIGLDEEIDGGFELCREIRQHSSTVPILFLTARDSDFDAIAGLRLGADDYLGKDISLPHLLARVAALLRRSDAMQQETQKPEANFQYGKLVIDLNRYTVEWDHRPVDLSLTEFWIVYSLARHPGHVKNRDQLMEDASIVVDDSTVTSHVKRIRRKFGALDPGFDRIDTVYGIGYRWKA